MATTYSTRYQLKLIGTGEEAGQWGTSTNNNISKIEEVLGGSSVISVNEYPSSGSETPVWDSGSKTLTWTNENTQESGAVDAEGNPLTAGRSKLIVFGDNGTDIGGTVTIKIRGDDATSYPDRVFVAKNALTGGQDIKFEMGVVDGTADLTLKSGKTAILYTSATAKQAVDPTSGSPATLIAANSVNNALSDVQLEGSIDVGNIGVSGNTISTTNTNGDLTIDPNGTGSIVLTGHAKPGADNTYDVGASGTEWRNAYLDGTAYIGTAVITGGSITDTSGAISFGNENLTTTGNLNVAGVTATGTVAAEHLNSTDDAVVADTVRIGTDPYLDLSRGSIVDTDDGAITFGASNLATTGTLASGALTVTGGITATTTIAATGIVTGATGSKFGDITISDGAIASDGAAISFGAENLSTSGTLASGALTVTGGMTSTTTIAATGTVTGATGSAFGDITLADGSITDSSGSISFGNENLSTSGTLASGNHTVTGTVDASGNVSAGNMTIGSGSINDSGSSLTLNSLNLTNVGTIGSGAITSTGAIAGTTITGSGIVTGASGSVFGNLTLADGSITDSSGAISFGNENLTTSGTLGAGATTLSSLVLASGATVTEFDTTGTLGTSDAKVPTQKAVKTYVDTQVSSADQLSELTDVNITGLADADLFIYDTGTSKWRNKALSGDATISDAGAITLAATNSNITSLPNLATAASLATVGTITTGVWNGTAIGASYLPTSSDSAKGIVELATTAETTTGTDATRAVTPDGLKDGYQGSSNVTTVGALTSGSVNWSGNIATTGTLDSGNHAVTGTSTVSTSLTVGTGASRLVFSAGEITVGDGSGLGSIDFDNNSLVDVNMIEFNDPGTDSQISWVNSAGAQKIDLYASADSGDDNDLHIRTTLNSNDGDILVATNTLALTGNQTISGTLASGAQTVTGAVDASGSVSAGTMTIDGGSIVDTSGAISFGDENLSTSGTLGAGAATVTSLTSSGGTNQLSNAAAYLFLGSNTTEANGIGLRINSGALEAQTAAAGGWSTLGTVSGSVNSVSVDGGLIKTGTTSVGLTVRGTANHIDVASGTGGALTISPTYAGGTSIASVGTVTAGTWAATDVAVAHGGTGASTLASGEVLLGNGTSAIATRAIGIADTNIVRVDHASAADNDYAKFTANGVEGRSYAEVKSDLSLDLVENAALSTFTGTANIVTVGTINSGTWEGTAVALNKGGTGATNATSARSNLGAVGSVNAGVLTDISGTTDAPVVDVDLSELVSGANADVDYLVVVNDSNGQKKVAKGDVNLSNFANDQSWTSNAGTVTEVTVATGLDVSSGTTTPAISLDLSELSLSGTLESDDHFITLENGAEKKTLISGISNALFSNGAGYTTNAGTITGVTTGSTSGLAGGGSSGSLTMNLDVSRMTDASGSTASANSYIPIYSSTNKKIKLSDLPTPSGVVTSVTATSPIVSSGGTTPALTFDQTGLTTLNSLSTLVINGGSLTLRADCPDGGTGNSAIGESALDSITSGADNVAVGNSSLTAQQSGDENVAIGTNALSTITSGSENVAIGYNASRSKATGSSSSTAVGYRSLESDTGDGNSTFGWKSGQYFQGTDSVLVGAQSGQGNSTTSTSSATFNTGVGVQSLRDLETGTRNTAVGNKSGLNVTSGSYNTSVGASSLLSAESGDYNTVVGFAACQNINAANMSALGVYAASNAQNVTTSVGAYSGYDITTGVRNNTFGFRAGRNLRDADDVIAFGYEAAYGSADDVGDRVIAIGTQTNKSGGSDNVSVGHYALSSDSSATYYGNTAIGNYTFEEADAVYYGVAVGNSAARYHASGTGNTAVGNGAMKGSTGVAPGVLHTAVGYMSQTSIGASSHGNTSVGHGALQGHETDKLTGSSNTAIGYKSGTEIGSGSYNFFSGEYSGSLSDTSISGDNNIGLGFYALAYINTGYNNIAIGESAGESITNNHNNILIGNSVGKVLGTNIDNCVVIGKEIAKDAASSVGSDSTFIIDVQEQATADQSFMHYIYGDLAEHKLNFNSNKTGSHVKIQNTLAGSASNYFLQCFNESDTSGGTEVFRVDTRGYAYNNGNNYAALADYADMFEWADGNPDGEDRVGLSVVLDGEGFCRPAAVGDDPNDVVGIVSGTANTIGNSAWDTWHGKYIKDDFGRVTEELNPEFDPSMDYVPREQRSEWAVIGLTGRVHVRKGSITHPSWRKIKDVSAVTEEWLVR